MYYFFSPQLVYAYDEALLAILENRPPEAIEMNWLSGVRLSTAHVFKFSIRQDAPFLDNYRTGSFYSLYSEKLVSLLREADVHFDLFPTETSSRQTSNIMSLGYKVFRLNDISDCLDEEKSQYKNLSWGKHRSRQLTRPHFTKAFLRSKKMLTRIAGDEQLIVIHSDLRRVLEDHGISGCKFESERLDETKIGLSQR